VKKGDGRGGTKKWCAFQPPTIHHLTSIDEVEKDIAVIPNSTAMKLTLDGERENSGIVTVASLLNLSKGYEASFDSLGMLAVGKGCTNFRQQG
jgi:hypothetical protein